MKINTSLLFGLLSILHASLLLAQSGSENWQDNPELANYLSKASGAKVHSCSSTDSAKWMVHNIIDPRQGSSAIWRTEAKKRPPQWVIIELPKERTLTTFMVNTAHAHEDTYQGVSARVLKVEFSVISPESGYKRVGREYLHRNKDRQIVSVEAARAKWVRLTIEGNWDFPLFAEIGRVYAYNDVVMNQYESILMSTGELGTQDIKFEVDKADLLPESMPIIETVAMALHNHPEWSLIIEGHSDQTGNESHNKVLSLRRAESVIKALVKVGIGSSRLSAKGLGSSQIISETDDSKNRRVVFRLVR